MDINDARGSRGGEGVAEKEETVATALFALGW